MTSAYLDALPGGQPADLDAFMKEVEDWALTDYATALIAGGTVDPGHRARVLQQMHEYTGLSTEYLDRNDLRVTAPEFEKELLRDQGLVVGRLDSQIHGSHGRSDPRTPPRTIPQSTAISSAYTSAFNEYVRTELGYDGDREYVPSGRAGPWNWDRGAPPLASVFPGIPNVAPDLADRAPAKPQSRGTARQRDLRSGHTLLRRSVDHGPYGIARGSARQHRTRGLRGRVT